MKIGVRLYIIVISLFVANTVVFILFQHHREKQYKINYIDSKLQNCNFNVHRSLTYHRPLYVPDDIRVTIIRTNGEVIFDNTTNCVDTIPNHSDRMEVRSALSSGHGYEIDRRSQLNDQEYFYSATLFRSDSLIIRSACPYNTTLINTLRTDSDYLWIALTTLVILILLLFPFIRKISNNISNLRQFASRADAGENVRVEEIARFSKDELGEICEHIIKLYICLQTTRQEQNRLKRELTQNVEHELKTPVAGIKGYLETMILNGDKMDASTREKFLRRSYAQVERLSNLILDISMLNRLDDGKDNIDVDDFDIKTLVQGVVNESEISLRQANMTVDICIPDGVVVNGAQSLVYSVFRNLLDNSIAYAGRGTHVSICAEQQSDSMIHFTFSDNGIGVPAEHLDRLFERFYRVDKGRSRLMGGTGLGLAIVKNAILFHGGTISVASQVNGGLSFCFTLPIG